MQSFKKISLKRKDSVTTNEQHLTDGQDRSYKNLAGTFKKRSPLIIAIAGVLFVVFLMFTMFNFVSGSLGQFPKQLVMGVASVFGQDLKKDASGKTNILILGIGGGKHDGADLTDTIMMASIDQYQGKVSLLSIPRDLYVEIPKVGGMKINGVYEYGIGKGRYGKFAGENVEAYDTEHAMGFLKEIVTKVTGVEPQYFLKVDFQGFIDIVNQVGGIEVDVPENFIDRQYPDNNYGYTTFFLRAGHQLLDGEVALKYARSRHSTSDFDRAKRQQIIINALREKAMQKDLLTNIGRIKQLYNTLSENIATDMNIREIASLASFASSIKKDAIVSVVLHDDYLKTGGFLYTPMRELFGGASVLIPDGATVGNLSVYKDIQTFVKIFFSNPDLFAHPPKVQVMNATLRNGKRVSGVATKISQLLLKYGISVENIVNVPNGVTLNQTTVYYFNPLLKEQTIPNILELVSAKVEEVPKIEIASVVGSLNENSDEPVGISLEDAIQTSFVDYDIVIIVGNDYSETLSLR